MSRFALKNLPLGLTIAASVCLSILIGLGVWQLQRLAWKEEVIAKLEQTRAIAPTDMVALLDEGLELETRPDWRAVKLSDCEINYDYLIYMHGINNAEAGYHVMTPCRAGRGHVLLELGFAVDRLKPFTPFSLKPVGRLRAYDKPNGFVPKNNLAKNEWYWRSASEISQKLGLTLRTDYFVVVDLQLSRKIGDNNALDSLIQSPITAEISNHHLEYALTWFALALILVFFYLALVRKAYQASATD